MGMQRLWAQVVGLLRVWRRRGPAAAVRPRPRLALVSALTGAALVMTAVGFATPALAESTMCRSCGGSGGGASTDGTSTGPSVISVWTDTIYVPGTSELESTVYGSGFGSAAGEVELSNLTLGACLTVQIASWSGGDIQIGGELQTGTEYAVVVVTAAGVASNVYTFTAVETTVA